MSAYERLWSEIGGCETCRHDKRIDKQTREHWQAIETPFLPYPGTGPEPIVPPGLPVRYLLVGMEPSQRPKKRKTREYMRRKIADGARNFQGDAHIRWAASHWLVSPGKESFVMTDLAKCMLPTKDADKSAPRRYANCSPWLGREIELFKATLRAIVPMGDAPYRWILAFAQESWPPITKPIVHPGMRFVRWKTGQARYAGLPREDEYAEFARRCDPKAKTRLDKRTQGLLARWQVQFAALRDDLARQER